MKIDAVIVTYNRSNTIGKAIESILRYRADLNRLFVIDNASEDDTQAQLARYADDAQIEVIRVPRNLGAPGGKNIGMRKSDADLIVIIDDDAEIFTPEPLKVVKEVFGRDPTVGIVQFKIVNEQLGKILGYEFPGPDPERMGDTEFCTGVFIGAGHCIRKKMLEDIGYYPDEFFYAHEEVDLSYRAVEASWTIRYVPRVGVYHKKEPRGRLPHRQMVYKQYKNRLVMSYRYLPLRYRLVSGFLWCAKACLWTRSVSVPIKALADYWLERRAGTIKRSRLSEHALEYLRRHHGRLWY